MFGKNPIEKKVTDNGQSLHLVKGSPFLTIQGEGPYTGHPALFIRLHGCNLACTFCDTQFSDPDDPILPLSEIVRLVDDISGWTRLVVITGGEPMRQNILPLCRELKFRGYKIQIETAGTLWVKDISHYAELVCSPKTPILDAAVKQSAIAFKYIIDCEMTFDKFIPITATQAGARIARLAEPRPGAPVYLSPMDTYDEKRNAENRKLVGQLAIEYNCIAGIQLHKFIGVD